MSKRQSIDFSRAKLAADVAAYALGYEAKEPTETQRGCRKASEVRQLAMYLTYTVFEMSLARCAFAFSRDRSTIAHACQAIEDRRDEDQFDRWVDGLELGLKALKPYAASAQGGR